MPTMLTASQRCPVSSVTPSLAFLPGSLGSSSHLFQQALSVPIWDILDRGGKRWRPTLLILVAEALGAKLDDVIDFVAVPFSSTEQLNANKIVSDRCANLFTMALWWSMVCRLRSAGFEIGAHRH
jgi:hypothetical protein